MAFVRLVEQHRGNTREFGIGKDHVHENRFGHDQDARTSRALAVQPCHITHGFAGPFAQSLRHSFRSSTRGDAARRREDDRAAAPFLVQQGGSNRSGLACTGWSDEHTASLPAQGIEQFGDHGDNRQVGHAGTHRTDQ